MIAEARQRRLAELPRCESPQCGEELRIEAAFVALHPAEITATRTGDRVDRLLLSDVLELRRAARDLRPQSPRSGERRGCVGGIWHFRLRDETEPGRRRTLELVLVGRVVALELGVRHGGQPVGGGVLRAIWGFCSPDTGIPGGRYSRSSRIRWMN